MEDFPDALAKFIAKTGAFSKTGDANVTDTRDRVRTEVDSHSKADATLGNRHIHHEGCLT